MSKKLLLLLNFIFFIQLKAQVGINTENPKVTLDVVSSPTNQLLADGIMAPQLTGLELKAKDALYNSSLKGTLIYVTEALTPSETTPKTINVTHTGYFYFDGNIWNGYQNTKNSTVFKTKVSKGQAVLNLSLLADYQNINFNVAGAESFYNGSVNPINTGGSVTIQESGIYAVGFYFRYGSGVNLSVLDLIGNGFTGVRINKNGLPLEIKSFSGVKLNIGLLGLGLLSVVISNTEINTIYKFEAGDQINFQTRLGGLIGLGLLSDSEGSFFMYKISD